MACGCAKKATTQQARKWVVTYPDGKTETKDSKASAILAQARVPGATIAPAAA